MCSASLKRTKRTIKCWPYTLIESLIICLADKRILLQENKPYTFITYCLKRFSSNYLYRGHPDYIFTKPSYNIDFNISRDIFNFMEVLN